ncbi:MAG: endonuclease/exonuclease/phosphatase family protein [Phycisphaeraceae bacterium]
MPEIVQWTSSAVQWACVGLVLLLVGATLLPFYRGTGWLARGLGFPRLQLIVLGLLGAVPYGLWFASGAWYDYPLLLSAAAAIAWQGYRILPYTPLWPKQVLPADHPRENAAIRLVISNVQMENRQFERWRHVVTAANPDVILVVEPDDAWAEAITPLREHYPHAVRQPQDNHYGMCLLSRFELDAPEVRFLVQDDVPSIHTDVVLPNGQHIYLIGVHPRPPQVGLPTTPRDAELVVLGRWIRDTDKPCVIGGDLNDVAWSDTTSLFLKISRMLDPRRGRGMYNSFHAQNPLLRFPLDQIFHTDAFKLVRLELLDDVGSDHFPLLIELSYEPAAQDEQEAPQLDHGDQEQAEQRLAEQRHDGQDPAPSRKAKADAD